MKRCYFCGAKAPEIKRESKEGIIYKMECSCGAKIEYKEITGQPGSGVYAVEQMWNYNGQ